MPVETGTAVAGAYLINIGIVGITGEFIGLPLQAVFIGGLSGAIVQGLRPPSNRRQGFFSVMFSVFLSGALTPLLVGWLVKNTDFIDGAAEIRAFEVLVPFVLGAGWPWLLPHAAKFADKFLSKWSLK